MASVLMELNVLPLPEALVIVLVRKDIVVYTMENAKMLMNAKKIQKFVVTVLNALINLVHTNVIAHIVMAEILITECVHQLKRDV